MPQVHTVVQGEHLASIAAAYGFGSYEPIWNHTKNAELRKLRTDPNVLFPGDQVFIPDPKKKTISCATTQRHQIVVKGSKIKLRIRLLDSVGEPLVGETCVLTVGKRQEELQTDGEGKLEFFVAPTDRKASIVAGDLVYPIEIGHLDPPDTASGVAARLGNLGHAYADPTELETQDEPRYFAMSLFVDEEKLDPKTQTLDAFVNALRAKHGV